MAKRVFILGSGFSKAINDHMPTLKELSTKLLSDRTGIKQIIEGSRFQSFRDGTKDVELLLTYLHQDYAWKKQADVYGDMSLFHIVGEKIADEIAESEATALDVKAIPDWLDKFVYYLYKTGEPVITFNYDTVLERVGWHSVEKSYRKARPQLQEQNFFSPLIKDIRSMFGAVRNERYGGHPSFPIIKLHGSVNWFYTRAQRFESQQLYFVPVRGKNPTDDLCAPFHDLTQDMQRLIIPPVADKSPFYSHEFVRSLWMMASQSLSDAEEIYFLGYSLPVTDLAVKLLLKSSILSSPKIFIVTRGTSTELTKRYQEALSHLPRSKFKSDYSGRNAISRLADKLFDEAVALPDRSPPILSWPNMSY